MSAKNCQKGLTPLSLPALESYPNHPNEFEKCKRSGRICLDCVMPICRACELNQNTDDKRPLRTAHTQALQAVLHTARTSPLVAPAASSSLRMVLSPHAAFAVGQQPSRCPSPRAFPHTPKAPCRQTNLQSHCHLWPVEPPTSFGVCAAARLQVTERRWKTLEPGHLAIPQVRWSALQCSTRCF